MPVLANDIELYYNAQDNGAAALAEETALDEPGVHKNADPSAGEEAASEPGAAQDGAASNEQAGGGPAIMAYKAWTDHMPAVTWRLPAEMSGDLPDDDQYMTLLITYDRDVTLSDADALLHQFDAYYGSAYINMKETGLADYDPRTIAGGVNDADKNTARVLSDARILELVLHIPARATSGILTLTAANEEGTLPALTGSDGKAASFPLMRMIVSVVEKDGSETLTLSQTPGTASSPATTQIRITNPEASTRGMAHYNLLINGVQTNPVNSIYNANITIHNHAYLTLTSERLAELLAGQVGSLGAGKVTASCAGNVVTITSASNTPGEVIGLIHVAYPRDRAQEADTGALYGAIRQAETASEADFTPQGWASLLAMLDVARSYYYSTWYTQAEVDAQAATLIAALDGKGGVAEEGGPAFIDALSHYVFNQNPASGMYRDINIRINLKGHTLTGVALGQNGLDNGAWVAPRQLAAGQDYRVAGDSYAITKEILRSLPTPPAGGYMVPVAFAFEDGIPALTLDIHITMEGGNGVFPGAGKIHIDQDPGGQGGLVYEYGKVTVDPSLLKVTSGFSGERYFAVDAGGTLRIPVSSIPAIVSLGQECDLCAGYIVNNIGADACGGSSACPDDFGFCSCTGSAGTSLGANASPAIRFYTDKQGNITGNPSGAVAAVRFATEGGQQFLIVDGLSDGDATITLEAFFAHPNPLKTDGVTIIPDGSGSPITPWYAWMGQRNSQPYEIVVKVGEGSFGGVGIDAMPGQVFDRNTASANYRDITAQISTGGRAVAAVTLRGINLPITGYTVTDGGLLTLRKEVLAFFGQGSDIAVAVYLQGLEEALAFTFSIADTTITTVYSGGGGGTTATVAPPAQPAPAAIKDAEVPLGVLSGQGTPLIFSDIAPGAWYADAVNFVTSWGLFVGTSATGFSPEAPMTRGMLVTVLCRLSGTPNPSARTSVFTDVKPDAYYAAAVAWANANGIVNGYSADRFGPEDPITREQLAAMLNKYATFLGMETPADAGLSAYTDANKISSWAESAMRWAVGAGIVSGMSATTLIPQGTATRAQVAAMLMSFLMGLM